MTNHNITGIARNSVLALTLGLACALSVTAQTTGGGTTGTAGTTATTTAGTGTTANTATMRRDRDEGFNWGWLGLLGLLGLAGLRRRPAGQDSLRTGTTTTR